MEFCSPYPIELLSEVGFGLVTQTVAAQKRGRVKFESTLWPARFYLPNVQAEILPNTEVGIVGRQGTTLLIMPLPQSQAWLFDQRSTY